MGIAGIFLIAQPPNFLRIHFSYRCNNAETFIMIFKRFEDLTKISVSLPSISPKNIFWIKASLEKKFYCGFKKWYENSSWGDYWCACCKLENWFGLAYLFYKIYFSCQLHFCFFSHVETSFNCPTFAVI